VPSIAGKARLINQTINDAVTMAIELSVIVLNKNTAAAPLVAISVSAKLGIMDVTRNVIAIKTLPVIRSGPIPNALKTSKYCVRKTTYLKKEIMNTMIRSFLGVSNTVLKYI
jgi:hypothetical protein